MSNKAFCATYKRLFIDTSPVITINLPVEGLDVMLIPPAEASISIAFASVPLVFIIRISSREAFDDAAIFTYASRAAFPKVKSFSSATLIVIPPALATILIASFPVAVESNLNPPVPADTSIKIALAPNFVDASLPIVIVLAEAPEPILIFCATASSPILITPAEEFKDNAPIVSHSNPFVPSCFIIVWLSPNLN